MNIMQRAQQWASRLGKYRYAGFVLLLGVCLMCLPNTSSDEPQPEQAQQIPQSDLQIQLEDILSKIDGAGEVCVLLSMQEGVSYQYQQDLQSDTTSDSVQMQSQTVFSRENGSELPVVAKTIYPSYRGAVVVCEGADRAAVQLAIVRVVSNLTGLGSDHIAVIKMKSK